MIKLLEIFKSGEHTDSAGRKWTFTDEQMQASVDAYDPTLFAAPLVIGHPAVDDPAWGWVNAIALDDHVVKATPEKVVAEFAEMVNDGRFPKMSASWFPPENPANPVPGVWYLRHVGFLGAAAPAVPGLKAASFSGDDKDIVTVDFSISDAQTLWPISRMARGLRDWLLEHFGAETADKALPDYVVEQIESQRHAAEEEQRESSPGFSAPQHEEVLPVPTEEQKSAQAKLNNQSADFAERETTLAAREKKISDSEAASKNAEIASFAESLVTENKLLPAEKEGLVSFMKTVEASTTVSFAVGDEEVTKSANEWLKTFLKGLPDRVDFNEHSDAKDQQQESTTSFNAPAGYDVDSGQLVLHNKALAYQTKNNCDYITAIGAVA